MMGLKERDGNTLTRSSNDVRLEELLAPLAAILDPLVLLKNPNHYTNTNTLESAIEQSSNTKGNVAVRTAAQE